MPVPTPPGGCVAANMNADVTEPIRRLIVEQVDEDGTGMLTTTRHRLATGS